MACSWNLGYEPHKVIENGTISRTSSYWPFTVTMAISCILSEIERANVQTSRYFHTPAFDGRARGLLTDYCDIILNGRTTMARLAEQTVTTMWGFVQPFDTVDKSDRRTPHDVTARHGWSTQRSRCMTRSTQLNSAHSCDVLTITTLLYRLLFAAACVRPYSAGRASPTRTKVDFDLMRQLGLGLGLSFRVIVGVSF